MASASVRIAVPVSVSNTVSRTIVSSTYRRVVLASPAGPIEK
jgi:hypothetical protein